MKYLITGITGTLGQAVCKILLSEPDSEVVGISRDEFKQSLIPSHERLTLYLGDIRDSKRLVEASRSVHTIFHFAALKHVDKLEENPEESVSTNIEGTLNVLHAQRVNSISRVIFSSTDKACYPVNVYGMSKGIAEKLILRNPNNVVCRYGNVLASRGSVIPLFVKSLKTENRINVTDPNMTRFWIPISEAAFFVSNQRKRTTGGLHIPIMKSCELSLIAETVAEILDIPSYHTNYIGYRPGEKVHECLRMSHEGSEIHSHTCERFSRIELKDLLTPIVRSVTL